MTFLEPVIPNERDILCGRGSSCNKYPGNQNFRFLVAVHLPKYTSKKTSKKQKSLIIRNVVKDLENNQSRFLKEGMGGWFVLEPKQVKAKVGHAMRDAAAEMERCLKKIQEKELNINSGTKHAISKKTSELYQPSLFSSLCPCSTEDLGSNKSIADNSSHPSEVSVSSDSDNPFSLDDFLDSESSASSDSLSLDEFFNSSEFNVLSSSSDSSSLLENTEPNTSEIIEKILTDPTAGTSSKAVSTGPLEEGSMRI